MAEKTISDVSIYFIVGVLLFFLSSNFDPNLALVFAIGLFTTWIYYNSDKEHTIVLERVRNRSKSITLAIVGYMAVLGISSVIRGALYPSSQSILELIAESVQASLAFSESLFLTFTAFAVLIPIVETPFLGMVIEFLKDTLNISFNKMSVTLASIFLIVSIGFMYLHLSAKGVDNNAALMTVLVFGLVTCALIYIEKQTMSAVLLHIISNSVAMAVSYNLFASISSSLIFGIAIAGGIILLLKNFRIIQSRGFKFIGG